jgi:hypothetical protein
LSSEHVQTGLFIAINDGTTEVLHNFSTVVACIIGNDSG